MADICGQCTQEFQDEAGYLAHTCTATGFTPTQPEHLGLEFLEVQKASLERAKLREDVDDAKQDQAIAEVEAKITEVQSTEQEEVAQQAPIYQAN